MGFAGRSTHPTCCGVCPVCAGSGHCRDCRVQIWPLASGWDAEPTRLQRGASHPLRAWDRSRMAGARKRLRSPTCASRIGLLPIEIWPIYCRLCEINCHTTGSMTISGFARLSPERSWAGLPEAVAHRDLVVGGVIQKAEPAHVVRGLDQRRRQPARLPCGLRGHGRPSRSICPPGRAPAPPCPFQPSPWRCLAASPIRRRRYRPVRSWRSQTRTPHWSAACIEEDAIAAERP